MAQSSDRPRRLRAHVAAAVTAAVGVTVILLALTPGGSSKPVTAGAAASSEHRAPGHRSNADAEMAPLPRAKPRLVEPVAGTSATQPEAELPSAPPDDGKEPKITGPASTSTRQDATAATGVTDLKATTATALPNGVALPPLEAPRAVLDVIQAGNIIARSPYEWGGGHGNFQDNGYDCSGSVTYALYYAGLIARSATSGELMSYGKPGPGKWISVYSNPGHVYMIVAGVRFDTVARKVSGSRWQNSPTSAPGEYTVRHPPGL